jgi:hypothetical protein
MKLGDLEFQVPADAPFALDATAALVTNSGMKRDTHGET